MGKPWVSTGVHVYDELGEHIAACNVPNIYSGSECAATAKQIADDHNRVDDLRALLEEALGYVDFHCLNADEFKAKHPALAELFFSGDDEDPNGPWRVRACEVADRIRAALKEG